ncbi:MAG: TIGR02452 family protein [Clostridiales bacterium]|nr:TIGR02452 family protein [Clostridiales bacterium]
MPNKEELINCFRDTLKTINDDKYLLEKTNTAVKRTDIFLQGSGKLGEFTPEIEVSNDTSFNAAKKLLQSCKRVAVLNFASGVNPGGGVTVGAMAQEECLCRSSNLIPCLKQNHIYNEFYNYHRSLTDTYYSDRIIYTPNVTVFKDDSPIPKLLPRSEWFDVDIITCAAPNMINHEIDEKVLYKIFRDRICEILISAEQNDADGIVLGAWGCGAYKNPPLIVAKAFNKAIGTAGYSHFKKISFAIKADTQVGLENLKIFENILLHNDDIIPETPSDIILNNKDKFKEWQRNNPLYRKNFSVFGDSISTLEGVNPIGYSVFYQGENSQKAQVIKTEDTWWGKVIGFFGGKLLVNNSYSGSKVTGESIFSGNSDARTDFLHCGGVEPDAIIIYLGFNDWAKGVAYQSVANHSMDLINYFDFAYLNMILKIKRNYPDSQIYCCTLNTTFMSVNNSFKFSFELNGVHIEKFNEIIRNTAKVQKCKLVDLYSYSTPYDSIDGSHPNSNGMKTLAKLICGEIADDAKIFLTENIDEGNIDAESARLLAPKASYCYYCGAKVLDNAKFCLKCGKELEYDLSESTVICQHCGEQALSDYQYCLHCGKSLEQPNLENTEHTTVLQEDEFPDIVTDDRYKLLRKIGRGGTSRVYLAEDLKIGRECAVKIANKTGYVNEIASKLLMEEANKMKYLAHISIPQLYDIIDEEGRLCIVMEYIEGATLDSIIRNTKYPLEEKTVVEWGKQLCNVLYYLHSLNPPRIFRDVKPSNIMLQPNGLIKLFDFGIMRTYDFDKTVDTCSLGTKGFAAPEQFGGKGQSDARTDIYALGMTLHYLLTGINPVQMPDGVLPIVRYRPELSIKLDSVIQKCVQNNPDDRYQNCMELLKDLENI